MIYSGVIAYSKGLFYRLGDRAYCTAKTLPMGLEPVPGTYKIIALGFDTLGQKVDAYSWQIKGWKKHSEANSAKVYWSGKAGTC